MSVCVVDKASSRVLQAQFPGPACSSVHLSPKWVRNSRLICACENDTYCSTPFSLVILTAHSLVLDSNVLRSTQFSLFGAHARGVVVARPNVSVLYLPILIRSFSATPLRHGRSRSRERVTEQVASVIVGWWTSGSHATRGNTCWTVHIRRYTARSYAAWWNVARGHSHWPALIIMHRLVRTRTSHVLIRWVHGSLLHIVLRWVHRPLHIVVLRLVHLRVHLALPTLNQRYAQVSQRHSITSIKPMVKYFTYC